MLLILGEAEGAIGAVLPEVDPLPQPVEVVHAGLERIAGEEVLCRFGVASMVGENGSVVAHALLEQASAGTASTWGTAPSSRRLLIVLRLD